MLSSETTLSVGFTHAQTADSGTSQRNVLRLAVTHLSAREHAETQILTCHPQAPTDRSTYAFPKADADEWSAPTWSDQPGGRVSRANQMAVILPCQGAAEWPGGPIDLGGLPS